uniref:Uncharacterized protein n=1 Tax=Tanacetum cinerariifolium TaxID=118510 RepID=A0A6L2KQC8_TANCI|nr:hypothetical protein [Tanacetum cinerariifolium]
MTPPPGFSTPPQIPNINTSERPPVTTIVFTTTAPEDTPFAYRASTLANHNPMISPSFVEANCNISQFQDEHILPAKYQPLPPVVSPTAEPPGYVAESDPEEYEDDETEDGRGGALAPADFAVVIPTDELVSPHEGTEPVIPPPSADTATTGARITVRLRAAISFPPEAEVERLLAIPTPSPSPLTSLSPPSAGERLARCTTPAALPSPPLPSPLHMLPPVDRRDDIPETEMPLRKRFCLSTLGSSTLDAEARQQGIGKVGYIIRDTWVDLAEAVLEISHMTVGEVNTRVTELAELHKHDTQDLYALLEDAQDSRTRISQRIVVDSQRVDLLMEDRIAQQETIQIMEDEAYAA